MKKLEFLVLFTIILNNCYFLKLFIISKEIQSWAKYNELKTNCLETKEGLDQEDIWLAAHGKIRSKLPQKWIDTGWVQRGAYDEQDPDCKAYAEHMCYIIDMSNPESVEHCHDKFLSNQDYQDYKKSHPKK